eukprot:755317-Hanusia_phi.AAC.4
MTGSESKYYSGSEFPMIMMAGRAAAPPDVATRRCCHAHSAGHRARAQAARRPGPAGIGERIGGGCGGLRPF